jgi:membrane protein required for colicin V production
MRIIPQLAILLESVVPPGKYLPIDGIWALIFLIVLVLGNLLGWFFKRLFQKLFLGWVDRTLGACLALVKGIVLSYLLIAMVTFMAPQNSSLVTHSRLSPVVVSAYQTMVGLIPEGSHEKLKKIL